MHIIISVNCELSYHQHVQKICTIIILLIKINEIRQVIEILILVLNSNYWNCVFPKENAKILIYLLQSLPVTINLSDAQIPALPMLLKF